MKSYRGYDLRVGEVIVVDDGGYAEVTNGDKIVRHYDGTQWYVDTEVVVTIKVRIGVPEGGAVDKEDEGFLEQILDAVEYRSFEVDVKKD